MIIITTKAGKEVSHDVDPYNVDEVDEISGDEQQKLVWCETHQTWEWHWLPL